MPHYRIPKISIIGGGPLGGCCALWAGLKELGNIVVIDVPEAEQKVKGHVLDLQEAATIEAFDAHMVVSTNYEDLKESTVVIIAAGSPYRAGMSREEYLKANVGVVKHVSEKVKEFASDSIVVVLSDPVDAMAWLVWKITGIPHHRVIGQGGVLDVARLKAFISMETGFSVQDINAPSLGHGEHMVPLPRFFNIGGIPVHQFMGDDKLTQLIDRTKKGAREIYNLTGTGAYIAPASAAIQIVEAIVRDKKRLLQCGGFCTGEFGVSDLFVGVPCILGSNGVEKIVTLELNETEAEQMKKSAHHVAELVATVDKMYPNAA